MKSSPTLIDRERLQRCPMGVRVLQSFTWYKVWWVSTKYVCPHFSPVTDVSILGMQVSGPWKISHVTHLWTEFCFSKWRYHHGKAFPQNFAIELQIFWQSALDWVRKSTQNTSRTVCGVSFCTWFHPLAHLEWLRSSSCDTNSIPYSVHLNINAMLTLALLHMNCLKSKL